MKTASLRGVIRPGCNPMSLAKKINALPLFWIIISPIILGLAVLLGYYAATRTSDQRPSLKQETPPKPLIKTATSGAQAPQRLAQKIEALGRGFDGHVGIAIRSINNGWSISFNGDRPFPQQSVSKLWVAAAIMDGVDRGAFSLADRIALTPNDLSIFHQPIRKKILAGGYNPALSELLSFAMTQSDNAANEALFQRVGGKVGVETFLKQKGISGITISQGEKELQMGIAGLSWDPRFSYDRYFWDVRNALPWPVRKRAIEAYVANPTDGATPLAVADGLAKLQSRQLISARSTAYLLDLMMQSKTGPDRLKSGLSPGWTMAHKTGTGQVLQMQDNEHAGIFTAYNDVGVLSSPQGQHYALVVMIGRTMRAVPERQALMRAVTQSVIACDVAGWASCR
jgi:beta-lactamase class A